MLMEIIFCLRLVLLYALQSEPIKVFDSLVLYFFFGDLASSLSFDSALLQLLHCIVMSFRRDCLILGFMGLGSTRNYLA